MPRRPNIKNLPSRLFEESKTPVYLVNAKLEVVYANPALADLFEVQRDELIGSQLKYQADPQHSDTQAKWYSLCPPPGLFHAAIEIRKSGDEKNTATEFARSISPTRKQFSVVLPDGTNSCGTAIEILSEKDSGEMLLMISLGSEPCLKSDAGGADWLHVSIQKFRQGQGSRFDAIPYLGDSPVARRCFAQAKSYALLDSNVAVVGHPQSQVVEIAKSIHYSGFSNLDEPKPLLPVNCKQVKGERIREILVGHCQVNLAESSDSKAHVLLIHADEMDQVAQRDLLSFGNIDQLQIRMISTSHKRLIETEGFDNELAHRLSTLELELPSLADRKSDLPFLAQNILEHCSNRVTSFAPDLLRYFEAYPWTGDYLELESVVQSGCDAAGGPELQISDCPHDFRMALKALESPIPKLESIDLDQMLSDIEKETIERAIQLSNGNKTNAARMLGITRARLHRKLAEPTSSAEDEDSDADR